MKNFLSKLRLSNYNIFLRSCIYVFVYALILGYILKTAQKGLLLFMHKYPTADPYIYLQAYEDILGYFTGAYIIIACIVDYFASKKRSRNMQ